MATGKEATKDAADPFQQALKLLLQEPGDETNAVRAVTAWRRKLALMLGKNTQEEPTLELRAKRARDKVLHYSARLMPNVLHELIYDDDSMRNPLLLAAAVRSLCSLSTSEYRFAAALPFTDLSAEL